MFISFVVSMIATIALIPLLTRYADRLGLVDQPGPRKVHERSIPRVGGIAILVGILAPLIALQIAPRPMLGILTGVLIVVAEGICDDRRALDYRTKFVAQTAAAIAVVAIGGIEIASMELFGDWVLPRWLSVPLTVLVLVALTNAINLADGLDGLAGGISFLCCAALGVLAYSTDNRPAVLLAMAICGALIGFLRFNTYPARVFMGDSGSQLLGLATAALAVHVTQSETSPISAMTPLFLLAIPILDTTFVMLQRIYRGQSPFLPDKNHLHHRLLTMGFRHDEAVALIYGVQGVLFAAAYVLRYESDLLNLGAFVLIGCAMLVTLWKGRVPGLVVALRNQRMGTRRHRLSALAAGLLSAALITYAALAVATLEPTSDLGVLMLALFTMVLGALLLRNGALVPIATKCASYVIASMLAWLFADVGEFPPLVQRVEIMVVTVIALSTVAALRFAEQSSFTLNTMDMLVLFMALVVPNLPGTGWDDSSLPGFAARLAVLFYALEFLLRDGREYSRTGPFVVLGVLAALAVRVWL